MQRLCSLSTMLLFVISATAADISSIYRWQVETEQPTSTALEIRRGESVILEPTFLSYGAPVDLSNADSVLFRYQPAGATNWYYALTGSVYNATSGICRVRWISSSAGVASSYAWDMVVANASSTVIRAYGKLAVKPTIGDTGTATNPEAVTELDFGTISVLNPSSAPWMITGSMGLTNAVVNGVDGTVSGSVVHITIPVGQTADQVSAIISNAISGISTSTPTLQQVVNVGNAATNMTAIREFVVYRGTSGTGTNTPNLILRFSDGSATYDHVIVPNDAQPDNPVRVQLPNGDGILALLSDISTSFTNLIQTLTPPPPPPPTENLYASIPFVTGYVGEVTLDLETGDNTWSGTNTFAVPALSTVSNELTQPGNAFATRDFARSLVSIGQTIYMTTNAVTTLGFAPTNATAYGSYDAPAEQGRMAIIPATGYQYIAAMVATSVITGTLRGPATVHLYIGRLGSGPVGNQSYAVKPELYYYEGTNSGTLLGDWDTLYQPIVNGSGATNSMTFTVAFADREVTNARTVWRLKGYGANTTNVIIWSGSNTASHVMRVAPSTASGIQHAPSDGNSYVSINGGWSNMPASSGSADIGSLRAEVDDLRLAQSLAAFSSFGRETALSYGTPYGRQSLFPTITDDIGYKTNCAWLGGMWGIGGTSLGLLQWVNVASLPSVSSWGSDADIDMNIYHIAGYQPVVTNAVYVYSSISNAWTSIASLPTLRANGAAVSLNGSLYYIGGIDSAGTAQSTVYKYNTYSNVWVSVSSIPDVRRDIFATTLNGRIYAAGGWSVGGSYTRSDVYCYSETSNSWVTVASMPGNKSGGTIKGLNNKLYAIGGSANDLGINATPSADVYCYSETSNSWVTVASLPAARQEPSSAVLNGSIYVIGGYNAGAKNDVYRYNDLSNTWTSVSSLPDPKYYANSVTVNGKIYTVGGVNASVYTPTVHATIPQVGNGGVLTSTSLITPYVSTRASLFIWVDSATKLSPDGSNYVPAVINTDWTNSISADNGATWTLLTNMLPIVSIGATNGYYQVVTNLNGSNILQSIGCASGTVVRARGWSRFGGN